MKYDNLLIRLTNRYFLQSIFLSDRTSNDNYLLIINNERQITEELTIRDSNGD